jgi:hypothetical protein
VGQNWFGMCCARCKEYAGRILEKEKARLVGRAPTLSGFGDDVNATAIVCDIAVGVPPRSPTTDAVVGHDLRKCLEVVVVMTCDHHVGVAIHHTHLQRYHLIFHDLNLHVVPFLSEGDVVGIARLL